MIVFIFICLYLFFWGAFFEVSQVSELHSIIGIIFVSSIWILILFRNYRANIVRVIVIAYFLRLLLLFLDYSGIPILHSGADTEGFYRIATNNINKSTENHYYLTNYTVFLTYLFKLIGPQRLFAQYINVILGMYTLEYTYKSLELLKINRKNIQLAMWLLAFMPNQVIFSGILLREAIIISTFTISFYYLLKWMKMKTKGSIILCLFFILLSSIMHSGMLGILIGYLYVFSAYDRRTKKARLSGWTVAALPLALVFFLLVTIGTGLTTSYLNFLINPNDMSSSEALLNRVNTEGDAGSAYLEWMNPDSIFQMILFLPLRVFHFLFSPVPWYWRGLGDIISFFADSLFFIWMIWTIYKKEKGQDSQRCYPKNIIRVLMVGIWLSIAMYSYGTGTAGTAMRHRANFFPILLICAMMAKEKLYVQNRSYLLLDNAVVSK